MRVEGFKFNENNNLSGEIKSSLKDGYINQKEATFIKKIIDRYGKNNIKIRHDWLVKLGRHFGLDYRKLNKIGPKLAKKIEQRANIGVETKKKISKYKVNIELERSPKRYRGFPGESHRKRQLKHRAIKEIEKDFPNLPNNEKKKLFKTIMESRGIKKDCYSFVYSIAKRLKKELPILNKFLAYNRKYNTKKNGYRGSMTEFLSKFEKVKSKSFRDFLNILKSSKDGSIFLVSMNTKGKPYYEHTGFVSIENGRIYFTHGETFKKSGAQGAKKTEIKERGGYFDSSGIRRRYKKGSFHLKRIA